MNAETKYTGERNGCRVTNLTTGNSEQLPGYSSYRIALEIAQDTADAAGI